MRVFVCLYWFVCESDTGRLRNSEMCCVYIFTKGWVMENITGIVNVMILLSTFLRSHTVDIDLYGDVDILAFSRLLSTAACDVC